MKLPAPHDWMRLAPLLDELLDLEEPLRAARLAQVWSQDAVLAAELAELMAEAVSLREKPFLAGRADAQAAPGDAAMTGLSGLAVGAYTLESPLGQGGSGSVWRARRSDGRYDAQVAIKLLHLSLLGHAAAERFRREGAILAPLTHPHIAAMLDAGVTPGGQPFIVLELVEGERIDLYCRRLRLDVEARLRLFLDVLEAVGHAHRHFVVHRDIKPGNVLVTGDGQVKLLDFGIAKLIDEERLAGDVTELTRDGGRALTPEYAAPEQFKGGAVTTATDVYALGVLLYQLLGGRHPTAPPDTGNAVDWIRALQETAPRRLSRAVTQHAPVSTGEAGQDVADERSTTLQRLSRRLAGDLDNILDRMLRKSPGERYATVDAVADDIRRHLAHEPISARPDSWTYQTAKFARRHRGGVAVTMLITLAIVAGVVGTIQQSRRAQEQAAIAKVERDRAFKQLGYAEAANEFVEFLLSEGWNKPAPTSELLGRARTLVAAQFAGDAGLRARMQLLLSDRYGEANDDRHADELLADAKASARGVQDPALQAELMCTEAYQASESLKLQKSLALFDQALRGLRDQGDSGALAACLVHRSVVERQGGDIAQARANAEEALAVLGQPRAGQRGLANDAQLARADALAAQKQSAVAVDIYHRVLADMQASGRGRSLTAGTIWNNLAVRLQRAGQISSAADALANARSINEQSLGEPDGGPTSLYNQGMMMRWLGDPGAGAMLERALASAAAVGDARTRANVAAGAAAYWCEIGDVARCAAVASQARAILDPLLPPSHWQRGALYGNEATIAVAKGDFKGARENLLKAIAIEEASGRKTSDRSGKLARLAQIEVKLGLLPEAAAHAAQAQAVATEDLSGFAHSWFLGRALLAKGQVQAAQGQVAEARRTLSEAVVNLQDTVGPNAPTAREAVQALASTGA